VIGLNIPAFVRNGCAMTTMTLTRSSSELTDSNLVQAAIAGNVDAFGELIGRHDRMVFHVAYCVTHNREDAEDAVQEACLKAYTNLGQFKGVSKFSTWLVSITVNEALAKVRRRRRSEAKVLVDEQTLDEQETPVTAGEWGRNPEQRYYNTEIKRLLANALQSLGPGLRTAFWLRYVEGMSTDEVAEALSLSVSAVKARLFRARSLLRGKLSKLLSIQRSRKAPKQRITRIRNSELCPTVATMDHAGKEVYV
jgi:RNA polymerase sigma-70 factor, ECF subfamily